MLPPPVCIEVLSVHGGQEIPLWSEWVSAWGVTRNRQALSQAFGRCPHCFAKDVDRMWWRAGMGNGMRRQAIREMREADGVTHSASGMNSESRAAPLTVAAYCSSLTGDLHNLAWCHTMFSPAAAWFSWKAHHCPVHMSRNMHWSHYAARVSVFVTFERFVTLEQSVS